MNERELDFGVEIDFACEIDADKFPSLELELVACILPKILHELALLSTEE